MISPPRGFLPHPTKGSPSPLTSIKANTEDTEFFLCDLKELSEKTKKHLKPGVHREYDNILSFCSLKSKGFSVSSVVRWWILVPPSLDFQSVPAIMNSVPIN
jgi:hypothetical protein